MSESPLRLYSKSGTETDWKCPRRYAYNYILEGGGIVVSETSLELYVGQVLHDAFAAMALSQKAAGGVDIELIIEAAMKQMNDGLAKIIEEGADAHDFVMEQLTLIEGLLRGFHKHMWPRIMTDYPVVKLVEQHIIYKHDGVGMMVKPDLVVGDGEGNNVYIEYKSTSAKSEEWTRSWETAVQVHSSIKAIEGFLNEPVKAVIVQGLYKGYESYGKLSTPLVYAYKRHGNPPFTKDEVSYEYKPGFKRVPVWDMAGGVKAWVASMPENVLADQFPQTPPIFFNEDLISAFFRQRATREKEIAGAIEDLKEGKTGFKQMILDEVFPQRFDQCWPAFRNARPCEYIRLCHGPEINPLESGFVKRTEDHLAGFKEVLEKERNAQP